MSERRLLVFGALPHSLGAAIAAEGLMSNFAKVFTAGQGGDEEIDYYCDATSGIEVAAVLAHLQPTDVVCTVGVNKPASIFDPTLISMLDLHWRVNVYAPMSILSKALLMGMPPRNFVVISSNSARIPRTKSAPYCASKAALSMALRCAARETPPGTTVWGYEPGLLAGTPMSQATRQDFPDSALHRMKGVGQEGLSPYALAARVIFDLNHSTRGLNGMMIPYDAGEQ